ncbi:MAG TPA: hypothetical protein VK178_17420 [Opitutaceae bacterium]|nr:hypothetical protein [Opitutaceae bacterium]
MSWLIVPVMAFKLSVEDLIDVVCSPLDRREVREATWKRSLREIAAAIDNRPLGQRLP